ncbi:MAG: trehalose 6-phosphate phosphorylase [Gemmatimonas sp. SG8_17]|nr:MAG: trehalose 6-phosphate phosphorylase [Gemmatimonas sp. SG8_17]
MTDDNERWTITFEGYDPKQEGLREALCALGNGFFVTRGASEEVAADGIHYPGTYIAGGYNRAQSEVAGQTIVNEDLVNFPNWVCLTFRPIDGDWVDFTTMEVVSFRRELNLREGILLRTYTVRDDRGRTTAVTSRRLVHMRCPQVAAIEYQITPVDWSGPLQIRSMLDGKVTNTGVERYRQLNPNHLRTVNKGTVAPEGVYLLVKTSQSRLEVAQAARTRVFKQEQEAHVHITTVIEDSEVGQVFATDARQGEPITVEKVVALHTSRDRGITESALDARLQITTAGSFAQLLRAHRAAWRSLWRRADVELELEPDARDGKPDDGVLLRLQIFHLLQTVSENTRGLDVSVPARGLHGEAYRGHIFWDELFILPFYLQSFPEINRSLTRYRYFRLTAARSYARESGYQGAMFPWQSSSNGREETQYVHLNPRSGTWDPDHSRLQRHINAAIVYNIWQHYLVTRRRPFIEQYGAEIIIEIARFWSSISQYNEQTERYEINGVMGPDEYHEKYPDAPEGGLRNNAYTNIMAVWCIERALEVLNKIDPERRHDLIDILDIKDEEIQRWHDITHKMTIHFHGDGIISQFQGYEDLEEFRWEEYRKKYSDIHRLDRILKAEGSSPDRYKVAKQPDLTMLFYLLRPEEVKRIFIQLGYAFDEQTIAGNIRYYMSRCSHGSTLSSVVFSAVLDRIDRKQSWELFRHALRADFEDVQGGTTKEGIHLGAMAGTINIVLNRYAGVDTTGKTIAINPNLPKAVRSVRMKVQYRGEWLDVTVTKDKLRIELEECADEILVVEVKEIPYRIEPGGALDINL